MTDSIALVGRTNVGKSLLFNKLVQYKNSIVLNKHGVTRDVNQGKILYEDKYLNLYDTAGITSQDEQFSKLAYEKTLQAIDKTLSENDLEEISKKIIDTVSKKTGATIRS